MIVEKENTTKFKAVNKLGKHTGNRSLNIKLSRKQCQEMCLTPCSKSVTENTLGSPSISSRQANHSDP